MCFDTVDREEIGEVIAYKIFTSRSGILSGSHYSIDGGYPYHDEIGYNSKGKYRAKECTIFTNGFELFGIIRTRYNTGFHAYINEEDAYKVSGDSWVGMCDIILRKVKLSGKLTFGTQHGFDAVCGEFMEILEDSVEKEG